jgi:hypothetical protein
MSASVFANVPIWVEWYSAAWSAESFCFGL